MYWKYFEMNQSVWKFVLKAIKCTHFSFGFSECIYEK